MPDGNRAGLPGQIGHSGEHRAYETEQTRSRTQTSLPLLIAVLEVRFDLRGVSIARAVRHILELEKGHGTMAQCRKRSGEPSGGGAFISVPAASATGTNANQVNRAMADVVISVPRKILGGKFPVARHEPFLYSTDDL